LPSKPLGAKKKVGVAARKMATMGLQVLSSSSSSRVAAAALELVVALRLGWWGAPLVR
jgi:hypothetical protein